MIKALLLLTTLLVPAIQNQNNVQTPLILFEWVWESTDGSSLIHGETIDGQGRVHSFNNKNDMPELKYRDWYLGLMYSKTEFWEIRPADVEKNLSMTDSVICTINPDTLARYVHLFSLLIKKESDFKSKYAYYISADAKAKPVGITALYGFIYEPDRDEYRRILIEEYGDIDSRNPSVYVSAFRNWKWCK